jgi:glutaredoxin
MTRQVVMYSRTSPCPFVSAAKKVFAEHGLHVREIHIDEDDAARARVLEWTGFLSVPTLVIADEGEITPYEAPDYLPKGDSPRGIDRGAMITEPSRDELLSWLRKHGVLTTAAVD